MSSAVLAVPSASSRSLAALPWIPLLSRTVLFAVMQALVAAGLALSGHTHPWAASAGWWPISATLTNLVSFGWILRASRGEGLRSFLGIDGSRWARDLGVFLGVLVLAGPIAQLPNVGLSTLLLGSPEGALALFVQPIPKWAALLGLVAFPLTVALGELPTYFALATRRMERAGWRGRALVVVPALFLAAQHVTLPLVFDARFVAWRLLMFVPFALYVGAVIRWRPRMLPWLMVAHGLIDASVAYLVYAAS